MAAARAGGYRENLVESGGKRGDDMSALLLLTNFMRGASEKEKVGEKNSPPKKKSRSKPTTKTRSTSKSTSKTTSKSSTKISSVPVPMVTAMTESKIPRIPPQLKRSLSEGAQVRSSDLVNVINSNVSNKRARPMMMTMPANPHAWKGQLTAKQRSEVRDRIKKAYASMCDTPEQLLALFGSTQEEIVHINSPSRLDYFKRTYEISKSIEVLCSEKNAK